MYNLFVFSTIVTFCTCVPRTPRIYNVLISSKKNLAPSQALPVYEPVLRTTSLGYAFSPFIYTPISTIESSSLPRYVHEGPTVQDIKKSQNEQLQPKQQTLQNNEQSVSKLESGSNGLPKNVLPLQRYLSYYTPLTYEPYYPTEERSSLPVQPMGLEKLLEEKNDPKQIVANLKKNPDIPDVPPPPLPVKT
ncbi:hypothetical protein NQ317_012919 [Molorchus minor]|uniref:Uncharacterized protein n=1 Tax=Molorchus minor TaxID=1323400 RepID=A0ABQ9JAM3_9CUCU|nr:hypothetical protein NQ317_012919 [Molorchus minor]